MSAADAKSLRAALLAHANAGGGWAYYPGHDSRLEPTCWALLALGGAASDFDPEPHWRFLTACQRTSGLLVENPVLPANLAFNALAAIAMLSSERFRSGRELPTLLDSLVARAGLQVAQSPNFRQDNSLRGWSWTEGTFSWVEPTSWCLLALKRTIRTVPARATDAVRSRITDGEALLVDRVCASGGWNFGNANAFGTNLPAHVPTSALGLLALQDKRDLLAVRRSLAFVEEHWKKELSGGALALSLLCLKIYGRPTSEVEAAIGDQWQHTRFLGNLATTSMVRCALTMGSSAKAALSLQ